MDRWSLTRALEPARLLRANPALLLAGPRTAEPIEELLRAWNPELVQDERGFLQMAGQVYWHGPFHLDPTLAADAGLPDGWSTAYAARSPRRRVRIPDGLDAPELRRRFPRDLPAGPEEVAWSLVTGLARLLDGAARLPGCAPYAAEPADTVLCVYGHDALPWHVLRTVLGLAIPDLARNGALAANDYCLEQSGALEIRVRPFGPDEFVPYALRGQADGGWPRTVYRFSCARRQNPADANANVRAQIDRLYGAAFLLADVIGGVLLDGDGFPADVLADRARATTPPSEPGRRPATGSPAIRSPVR
jgi:hypothetical protein